MTATQILDRHASSLRGRLIRRSYSSAALRIDKPFYVYLPPSMDNETHLPVLYLFRGHEREWVNINEDTSRQVRTSIEDLDLLISSGDLPPLMAVMPGLNSSNNHVPSLGINMVGQWTARMRGLGSGRFCDFLTHELIPYIDRKYPQTTGSLRMMAGFSLGGFTVSLLAQKMPGYFRYAGIFDGLFMWPDNIDPRHKGRKRDRIWQTMPIFDPALGYPRDRATMAEWNTTDTLLNASSDLLDRMRETSFLLLSAAGDRRSGNRDRCTFYFELLREKGITVLNDTVPFSTDARHDWHWNDRFLAHFLMQSGKSRHEPVSSGYAAVPGVTVR